MNGTGNSIAGVGRAVHGQFHVVQKKTKAVIANGKLNIVESSTGGIVNDLLDAVDRIVFSAAVQEHDVIEIIIIAGGLRLDGLGHAGALFAFQRVGCAPSIGQSRNGQDADRQDKREQNGKKSCQILFHGLLSLLIKILEIQH